jgi:hypothetical protein
MVTVTAAVWEVEELAECVRCGGEMTIAPVLAGIELNGSYVCHPCFFFVFDGSRARAAEALGLEPSGDGDGPEPDGGPAAPAARPGTLWLIVSGQSVPRELTAAEEAELAEFSEACAETAPLPEPCARCGRGASPFVEVANGRLCFRCWPTGPTGPRPDRAALASVWLDTLTELRAAYATLARIDVRLAAIRAR